MTHNMTSNNQKEAKSKRKPPSEPICCTTTGRSAANSLAQTIGAASLSTREAQVKSTASPPHLRERRSQLRLARRSPEFYGQAHERRDLVQLPCSFRSDVAHAALNSAAAQALVAHELAFHSWIQIFFLGRGPLDTQATPATSEATAHPGPGHSPHLSGGRTGRTRSATPPSGPRPSRHAPAPPVGQPDPARPSGAAPPPEPTPGGRT